MTFTRVDRYKVRRKQLLESRDAVKAARPVRRGDDGKGASSHLASVPPYFLTLKQGAKERDLQNELLAKLRNFLVELGSGFAFMGSEYPLRVSDQDFYLDLLFYHYRLRCLVVIDLKIGEFKPEDAGKMNFYLSALDEQVKHTDDRPSVGIILCKSKDRLIADYALRNLNRAIGISTYQLKELPEDLQSELPSVEQLQQLLIDTPPS